MQGSANLNVNDSSRRARLGACWSRISAKLRTCKCRPNRRGDFVSRADIAAEAAIREILTEARPNYGWLGEESAPVEGKDPTRRWIVDPLDGTTNFLHGMPHWAVSIALEFKGRNRRGRYLRPGQG